MNALTTALATVSLLSSASGAEFKAARNGKAIFSQYIIRLNPDQDVSALKTHIADLKQQFGADFEALDLYENLGSKSFLGYAAKLSSAALQILLRNGKVMYVEEDQTVHLNDCQQETNPDWGLARTNYRNYDTTQTYTYDYTTGATGAGVDAYIIDTGIYCENDDFTKKAVGKCSFGYSSVKNIFGVVDTTDGNGHGTHCAGTVAGQTYGVAKEANLIAVKVMSDAGSGSTSNIVSGINWVAGQAKANGRPSVANLSIGGGYSQANNDAVAGLVGAGVTTAVAAGNDNSDACNYSPASEPLAITVAATDKYNSRAYYSNYGACCDVFGPGSNITSAWIDSPSATNTISGTSMASPHVCGVAAKYLSASPASTPADITALILKEASKDEISDPQGTPNLMVYGYCSA
jgi:subtilisin family serine protease